jgi:hypothetical protein
VRRFNQVRVRQPRGLGLGPIVFENGLGLV